MTVDVDDIQALGDVLEPISGRDMVALFDDPEAMDTLRYGLKKIAADDFVCEMVGAADGITGTFKGPEGFIEGWRDFIDTFGKFENTIEEVIPAGDRIVVTSRQRGTTTTGGVEIENEGAGVFTFDEGKLTRAEFHLDRESAMHAAGLEPR